MNDKCMIGRLDLFIKYLGMSVRSFEDQIGASNGVLRKAIKNNSHIQSKWIEIIVDLFPQLNPVWLLTGRGDMIQNAETFNNQIHSCNTTNAISRVFKLDGYSKLSDYVCEFEKLNKIIEEKDLEIDQLKQELVKSKNEFSEILKKK